VSNQLTDNRNGTYTVNYIPHIPTDHIVTVTLDGRVVGPQGPITVPVTLDPKISALNSRAHGPGISPWGLMTKQPTQFTIIGIDQDGKEMKNGDKTADFDIKFNDSRNGESVHVKTQVIDNDNGTFTVTYETPDISGPYALSVVINNQDLAESPFDVFMRGRISYPDSIMLGLNSLLRSDVPVEFTIRARDVNGQDIHNGGDEFDVVITYNPDDDDVDIPTFIEDNQDGTHTVKWTPKRAGQYKIMATSKDGASLKNSPVILTMEPTPYAPYSALKPKSITKSHKGMVTADFDLDLHDKFNKKFNNIKTRITAKITDENGNEIESQIVLGDDCLSVKFVPKKNKYICSVRLDGKEIGSGPIEVNLTNRYLNKKAQLRQKVAPFYCEAHGPGLEGANKDIITMFTVEARDEKGELMQVGESDYKKNCELVMRLMAYQPHAYDGDTNPLLPFQDLRELRKQKTKSIQQQPIVENIDTGFDDDMQVENNPYYQEVSPLYYSHQRKNFPCKIRIVPPSDMENEQSEGLDSVILNTAPGVYTILYRPNEQGEHEIHVTADEKHIPRSPFTAIVAYDIDAANCGLEGPGLKKAYVGKPTYFNIIARDGDNCDIRVGGDDFEVFLKDPAGKHTMNPIIIDDLNSGTYKVTYTPSVAGAHTVSVKYRGENLRDSPFQVTAKDVTVAPDHMKSALIGKVENVPAKKPCKYNVKLVNSKGEDILSGGDIVRAIIKPKKGTKITKSIPEFEAYVVDHGTGRYTVEFTPEFSGEYEMVVNVGSDQLPLNSTAFEFTVLPTVSSLYTKLSNWTCNIESQKAFDTNDLHINVISPQGVNIVPYIEKKHGKLFTVYYEPPEIESGWYEMNVQLANKNKVRGSPFHQTFAYLEHFDEEPQQSDIYQFEANQ
jgi:filamin